MVYTPAQALARAKARKTWPAGMCLNFVRTMYGIGPKYPHATAAWQATKYRHTSTPPKGVPVWWTGGSKGYGHVAISDGGGYCISTDYPSSGRVGRVSISAQTRRWGHRYRGWSEDLHGVRVYKPAAATKPTVKVGSLTRAARLHYPTKKVLIVQKALKKEVGLNYSTGPGFFGPRTKAAYAKWQRKLGFTGKDADGIPGYTSLKRLGDRNGFIAKR